MFKGMKSKFSGVAKKAAVGVVVLSGAASAFAQTAPASGVDVTSVVSSINNVAPSIVAVGGAVIGIAVLAWGFKAVKGFIGR